MKRKEIVVLDCGVDVRQEEPGIIFTAFDPGREFAFVLKAQEVGDMIRYLNDYISKQGDKVNEDFQLTLPGGHVATRREPTVNEKAAMAGVVGKVLADPSSIPANARHIPASAVSIHKG